MVIEEISQKTGVPLHSCERYVAQLRKNGQIPEIHHSGRPRKIPPSQRRQIGKLVNRNHFVTASEIEAQLKETNPNLEVSERTVQRELSRLGYVATLPRRVPLLTQSAKEIRLQWAHDHCNYNWKKVVFSDETTLQMFRNTCLAWFRTDKPVVPMVKHPFKLHMWGAISTRRKIVMHVFTENMDRHLYLEIIYIPMQTIYMDVSAGSFNMIKHLKRCSYSVPYVRNQKTYLFSILQIPYRFRTNSVFCSTSG